MTLKVSAAIGSVSLMLVATFAQAADEWSANVGLTNNYIWRGLTQTQNDVAASGGIDFSSDSGFYAGTWVSNVSYAPGDVFSYEHDVYFGFAGDVGVMSYDVGYFYYNYDTDASFDFAEVYGSVSAGGLSAQINLLAHTEADEAPGQDFGFAQAVYFSLDYTKELRDEIELGFHLGWHDGDFNEAFNGVPDSYTDYSVSVSKGPFSFTVTNTDLDDAGADGLDNDDIKFVIGYAIDFEL